MLITEKLKIKTAGKNFNYFKTLGYNIKYGDIINIDVKELSKDSHCKVKVKCDICGKEKEISYREYLRQNTLHNFDTCKKCKNIKNKKTNLERYGSEHIFQTKEFFDKYKKTMLNRYGVENPAHSSEIQEKRKETIIERYGVEHITQSEEFKRASRKTKKERYNNENYNNYDQISTTKKERYNDENYCNVEKTKITNLEKYGVENVSQNKDIKNKKKETTFKNYGVEHPLQSDIIIKKLNDTCMKRYGATYSLGSKLIIKKTFDTNVENNRWLKYEDRPDFYNYYLLVCGLTLKNKKELLENWNGYDYYSNEYILDNFNLNSNDKKYPTIDHKKSVRYGFDNNISAEEISNIENLCITTRSNNSTKGGKIETDFNIYKI